MKSLLSILLWLVFVAVPASAIAGPDPPLSVQIDGVDAPDARGALRAAIEQELGRPVQLVDRSPEGSPLLYIAIDHDHATLVYRRPDAPALDRAVDLPRDEARRIETIALLSGNLLRNEADELVEELRRRAQERDAATTPETPTETAAPPPATEKKPPPPAAKRAPARRTKPAPKPRAPADDLLQHPGFGYDLTFAHPLGLLRDSERWRLNLELGFAYSNVGAIRGIGANLFVLRVERDVRGVAVASLFNHVGGDAVGAQLTGLVNVGGGNLRGASLAGLVNLRGGDAEGAIASGVFNRARDVTGVELAAVNVARDLEGVQVGVVNVGRKVRGAQIGLVNVTDELHGVPVGVVNVSKSGHVRAVAWTDARFPISGGVRFEPNAFVTTLAGGYDPVRRASAAEVGAGARLTLGAVFGDIDALYAFEHLATGAHRHGIRYGADVGVRVWSYLGVFGGGGIWQTVDTSGISETAGDYHVGIELF